MTLQLQPLANYPLFLCDLTGRPLAEKGTDMAWTNQDRNLPMFLGNGNRARFDLSDATVIVELKSNANASVYFLVREKIELLMFSQFSRIIPARSLFLTRK